MKFKADGKEVDARQLAIVFNERGRVLQRMFHTFADLKDLAEAGDHQELAARVILEHDWLVSNLPVNGEGIPNTH